MAGPIDSLLDFFGMGPPPKLADIVAEKRRELQDARYELDGDCREMDRSEKRVERKIKERATSGKMREVKALAKQIVQYQRARERLIMVQTRLQEVETTLATVRTQKQLTESLTLGVRVMRAVRLGIAGQPSLKRVMMLFAQEQQKATVLEEEMDAVTGLDDDEDEEDELVEKVLADLDIQVAEELDGMGTVVRSGGGSPLSAADRAREQRLVQLSRPTALSEGGPPSGDSGS